MVIDACKPWARRDSFPIEARSSKELEARVWARFAAILPKGHRRSGLRSLGWRSAALPFEQTAPGAGNPGAALPIGR